MNNFITYLFIIFMVIFGGFSTLYVVVSLPELVTSAVATKKGETGLAIGNVIGSNIFNAYVFENIA